MVEYKITIIQYLSEYLGSNMGKIGSGTLLAVQSCPSALRLRACSVYTDWSSGMVPSRITSIIYINFYEL
jgi:hypothetical protein